MREKFFNEMINFVKVFSFLIIVCSLVIISVKVCETAKHDFKLKNIFKFFDDKRHNKKTKKDIKHQIKDYKIHYIDNQNRHGFNDPRMRSPFIHTLMPLPLPVHLPLPVPQSQQNHFVPNHENPLPPPPMPPLHGMHLHYDPNTAAQMMAMESSPMLEPPPAQIHHIIHHQLHPVPVPMPMSESLPDGISNIYPVFERIETNPDLSELQQVLQAMAQTDDNDIHHGLGRAHPNAHSYGGSDDTILNMGFDNKHINTNKNNNHRHRHKQNHKERDKSLDSAKSKGIRIVNNNKFKELYEKKQFKPHFEEYDEKESNREEDNKEEKKEENRSNYRNTINNNKSKKINDNSNKSNNSKVEDFRNEKHNNNNELSSMSGKVVKYNKDFVSNSVRLDRDKWFPKTTTKAPAVTEYPFPTVPIPDEQLVHMLEDKWTFKDLDLWVVR